ncbi:MAG: hypothetical protein LBJ41_06045 [Treponema sp.]|jgi:carbon starvation protein CstA|nr:hypothetical protein [Treponema sp.]
MIFFIIGIIALILGSLVYGKIVEKIFVINSKAKIPTWKALLIQFLMMARCIKTEGDGRNVFYGALIIEGVVAMIWAAAAMAHFGSQEGLAAAVIVKTVSIDLMGPLDGVLAVLGVVACLITSGDTAFRSDRLAIADISTFDQKPIKNRFIIAVPLFVVGILLVVFAIGSTANFNMIWRYFVWSNKTLVAIALWTASAYLAQTSAA